jgi:hypothetical protein
MEIYIFAFAASVNDLLGADSLALRILVTV